MASVLRKNQAWLRGLIKEKLSIVVTELCRQNVIPLDAREEATCESENDIESEMDKADDAGVCKSENDIANSVWNAIEDEMGKAEDECVFGQKFVQVLIDSGIGNVDDLKKIVKEFKDEEQRASRRSSVASSVGCLDSSSSSVFMTFTDEREINRRRASTESLDGGGRSRKNSSERKDSTGSNSSLSIKYSPDHSTSISQAQKYAGDTGSRDFEQDRTLVVPPLLPAIFEHPDIDSPDNTPFMNPYCTPNLTTELSSVDPSPESGFPQPAVDSGSNVDLVVDADAFVEELERFVREVEPAMCQEDAERGRYHDKYLALKGRCERMSEHYQYQIDQLMVQRQQAVSATQIEVERVKEEVSGKLNDKEQQLDKRKTQVAELEKRIHKVSEEKKMLENDCAELRQRLLEKEEKIKSLERTIEESHSEVQFLRGTDDHRSQLEMSEQSRDQWIEMKKLVDHLFQSRDTLQQAKLAIRKKVEMIKTNYARPNTS